MENLSKSLDRIITGHYSLTDNGNGTFEVQTIYNINTISFERGVVKFVNVKQNKK